MRSSIFAAAVEAIVADGYADVSLAQIARSAGVAVTTVYRRWPTKGALLGEIAVELTAVAVPEPDTGTLRADLLELGRSVVASLAEPTIRALVRSILALPADEYRSVSDAHWAARHAVAESIVLRAVERGELPPQRDPRRVVEVMTSAIWMRTLIGDDPIGEADLEQLVAEAIVVGEAAGRT